MDKTLTLPLSCLLIFESSAAFATTPKLPPRHMTIGLLQIMCKKDGKSNDRSNAASDAYCQGYLNGLVDSYFAKISVKRASFKRNPCVMFPSNDWLRDEMRDEILAISEGPDLDLDYGLPAEPWIRGRLVAKCGPAK